MGRDHGHPYILSTTVLSDIYTCIHVHCTYIHVCALWLANNTGMPVQELQNVCDVYIYVSDVVVLCCFVVV